MSSRIFAISENLDWKQAYRAAILETDRTRILGLIEDARAKLATRLLELKTSGVVLYDEVETIDDALFCYRLWRAVCCIGMNRLVNLTARLDSKSRPGVNEQYGARPIDAQHRRKALPEKDLCVVWSKHRLY